MSLSPFFAPTIRRFGRLTLWAALIGCLAGTASAFFLWLLNSATTWRESHPTLLYALPLGGFGIGLFYHRWAGIAVRGNNLIIEQLHKNDHLLPLRMAPMVLLGSVATHFFGGSAGREGTAVQMGASLADWLGRQLGATDEDRPFFLLAGISAGFSSLFGTPLAGLFFGLELPHLGRLRYEAIWPCLVAVVVGDRIATAWGATHAHYPALLPLPLNSFLLAKVAVAGVAFGLVARLFVISLDLVKAVFGRYVTWPPLRPFIGGCLIILLTHLVESRDYLGLSLPLLEKIFQQGAGVITSAFLLKLIFTCLTLGTGFLGGEVTPLFVIGATFGFVLGGWFGVDPLWFAAIGFVALFGAAAHTPFSALVLGLELFAGTPPLYWGVACFCAYLAVGRQTIYPAQPAQFNWHRPTKRHFVANP